MQSSHPLQPIKWSSKEEKNKTMISACYNVRDEYKGLTKEEIQQKNKENSLPFAVMMAQIAGDFNFGSVVRSANAMGAREIFYFGKKQYDARSSLGAEHYSEIKFLRRFTDLLKLKDLYTFIALENTNGANNLANFKWYCEKEPLILIGEESVGLSQEILDLADHTLEIKMLGSIRSLNAASAATVAMYDFVSKYKSQRK